MSNNEDNFGTSVGILKYRLDELEKLVKPLIDLVNQQNASENVSNYEYRKQESKSMEELKREIEILKGNTK